MPLCHRIGSWAPRAGRKPDRLGILGGRLFDMHRNGRRSAEHYDEVDGDWNVGQAGERRQPGDFCTIGADWNDVVAFMREVLCDLVTVTIGTRAGADDRDCSGPLQDVSHDALGR
jgi:hypothetical protein